MEPARETGYLHRPVGELVAEDYTRAAVFAEAGIDFCCGGGRTVAQACEAKGISPDRVVDALEARDASSAEASGPDVRTWSLGQLVDHIETEHHGYLRRTLPVLGTWTDKIARVHGGRHPELVEVRALVAELASELDRHMEDEEEKVFPLVTALEAPADDGAGCLPVPEALVEALEDDHDHAGSLMRRIRDLTDGFSPPPDACATYTASFVLLREFEADLHRHVHLENNVLFPRARSLNARRSGPPSDKEDGHAFH
ncbi:MAG: iron-sulfur cluster repair di-iron protein [Longimicrobiales bacterium]|nr:iron-sulfur cluster repair di-iron protein [Longimicrobiales bacterium]